MPGSIPTPMTSTFELDQPAMHVSSGSAMPSDSGSSPGVLPTSTAAAAAPTHGLPPYHAMLHTHDGLPCTSPRAQLNLGVGRGPALHPAVRALLPHPNVRLHDSPPLAKMPLAGPHLSVDVRGGAHGIVPQSIHTASGTAGSSAVTNSILSKPNADNSSSSSSLYNPFEAVSGDVADSGLPLASIPDVDEEVEGGSEAPEASHHVRPRPGSSSSPHSRRSLRSYKPVNITTPTPHSLSRAASAPLGAALAESVPGCSSDGGHEQLATAGGVGLMHRSRRSGSTTWMSISDKDSAPSCSTSNRTTSHRQPAQVVAAVENGPRASGGLPRTISADSVADGAGRRVLSGGSPISLGAIHAPASASKRRSGPGEALASMPIAITCN